MGDYIEDAKYNIVLNYLTFVCVHALFSLNEFTEIFGEDINKESFIFTGSVCSIDIQYAATAAADRYKKWLSLCEILTTFLKEFMDYLHLFAENRNRSK